MSLLFRITLLFFFSVYASISWSYSYDADLNASNHRVIGLELQNQDYDATSNLCYSGRYCAYTDLQKKVQDGFFFTFVGYSIATKGTTLDLFGGRVSQIPGAINVDLIATSGVRASTSALPFRSGSVAEVIASGPQASFLNEAARVLQPGGQLIINASKGNKFGRLPSASVLEFLGLRVVQQGPLSSRFSHQVFRRTDGGVIPSSSVNTTILERF